MAGGIDRAARSAAQSPRTSRTGGEVQLSLQVRSTWGGRRAGAGRKPLARRLSVPHRTRPGHRAAYPVHVTLRVVRLPSLREQALFRALRDALSRASKASFRLLQFSVQSNHLHLVVEASDRTALTRGMQGLSVRMARAVNGVLGRRGPLLSDRHHRRALRTPREVRTALRYVLCNRRKHGSRAPAGSVDPCSSGPWFDGWREPLPDAQGPPPVAAPRTWLARAAWRRHGLISVDDVPRS